MRSLSLYIIGLIFFTVSASQAQRISRVNYGIDLGSGFSENALTPSITYYQNLTFGDFRHVGIGWTGRFSGNIIKDPVLTTLGNPTTEDEISLKRAAVYSAAFGLTVNFNFDHIEFGANVDLVNISMGKTSKVLYKISDLQAASDSSIKFDNTLVQAFPQLASLVPIATKKSNGHSEVYLRLWINQEFGLKFGYQLQNVVYNSQDPLSNGQKRFVNRYGMPFAALSFRIQN
jgi:hypothetical protein